MHASFIILKNVNDKLKLFLILEVIDEIFAKAYN
jgi:hypothetical protein